MKNLFIIIILLVEIPLMVLTVEPYQVKLIKDLVKSENTTILINVVGCWDRGTIVIILFCLTYFYSKKMFFLSLRIFKRPRLRNPNLRWIFRKNKDA